MIMGYPAMAKDSKLMRKYNLVWTEWYDQPIDWPRQGSLEIPCRASRANQTPRQPTTSARALSPVTIIGHNGHLAHGANRLDRPWIIPLPPAHRALSLISLFFFVLATDFDHRIFSDSALDTPFWDCSVQNRNILFPVCQIRCAALLKVRLSPILGDYFLSVFTSTHPQPHNFHCFCRLRDTRACSISLSTIGVQKTAGPAFAL